MELLRSLTLPARLCGWLSFVLTVHGTEIDTPRNDDTPPGEAGCTLDGDTEWGTDLVGEGGGNSGGGISGRAIRGANRPPSSANLAGGWPKPWGKVSTIARFVASIFISAERSDACGVPIEEIGVRVAKSPRIRWF